ncbi:hypothetical protein B2J86_07480 [Acidovorax sp. SRB_14]|uniref:hypothetical protein n=1 Tax=Acidovorax sp. SRB_14 TaxID=1962699 RepID=UPI00146ADC1E|nr:hypothetical protein [Acidovorax sp. SRB_14]NMM80773.1 hypothetical protein [Acidovorax sp. SRB_14]NMM85745.1 hypothetical protein [Rhodococcus sp. SRB_17]
MKDFKLTPRMTVVAAALTVLLSACGEKPQTAGTRSADVQAWNGGAQTTFNVPGWAPGDKVSWEEQIKQRNRSQNEYVRMAP